MKHYIIPIFIPHYGCTHQCVFCNQKRITGVSTPMTPEAVASTITEHLSRIDQPRHIEVAFYGGSFTALPLHVQQALLTPAHQALLAESIHAIRLSTRPDCINPPILEVLQSQGVSIIELGAQSLNDDILRASARGHSANDVANAVRLIKNSKIQCGLQLMVGLPSEDWPRLIQTTYQAVELQPDFARIYPTLVIADTHLARLYKDGLYSPLSISEAASRSAFMKIAFERNKIPVIRTGLQASSDLADSSVILSGPYHPSFGEIVDSYIFNTMVVRCLDQISYPGAPVTIYHHTKDTSKLRGLGNTNLNNWRNNYKTHSITLRQSGIPLGQLLITTPTGRYTMTMEMLEW